MNDILDKILANKTPEEFAKEISEVRKIVGQDNELDMSVEDALGMSANVSIDFQYPNITGDIENINVSIIPCISSSDIFDQTTSNDAYYSLAA